MSRIPGLRAAFNAVAPSPDFATKEEWCQLLDEALTQADITSPERVAAFLGQAAHETGGFRLLVENVSWKNPERLDAMFSNVTSVDHARQLIAAGPEAIANCIYGNRQGNGPPSTGDGYRFRGRGVFQLTGRAEVTPFAEGCKLTPEAAADWLVTPAGAIAGAVWYWTTRHLSPKADARDWDGITRAINGSAMVGRAERTALTIKALSHLEGATTA